MRRRTAWVALSAIAAGCAGDPDLSERRTAPYAENLSRCAAETRDASLAALAAATGACRAADLPTQGPGRVTVEETGMRRIEEARAFAVTTHDLSDDSVRDERLQVELVRRDGAWHVAWVGATQRCWPDRGHASFSPRPCL